MENQSLRAEIGEYVKETRNLEYMAVIGTAAIYSWLLANISKPFMKFGSIIPVLLSLLGGLRSYALLMRIKLISEYIMKIESEVFKDINGGPPTGWEYYFQKRLSEFGDVTYKSLGIRQRVVKKITSSNVLLSRSAFLMWVTLFAITALVPFYLFMH